MRWSWTSVGLQLLWIACSIRTVLNHRMASHNQEGIGWWILFELKDGQTTFHVASPAWPSRIVTTRAAQQSLTMLITDDWYLIRHIVYHQDRYLLFMALFSLSLIALTSWKIYSTLRGHELQHAKCINYPNLVNPVPQNWESAFEICLTFLVIFKILWSPTNKIK